MPPDQQINPLVHFLPFTIILIWYFLVFKPQRDRQEQHKKTLSNLKKNDEIVTTGGIHGTIVNVKDTTIVLRIDDNARMEIDKTAIGTVTKKAEGN